MDEPPESPEIHPDMLVRWGLGIGLAIFLELTVLLIVVCVRL